MRTLATSVFVLVLATTLAFAQNEPREPSYPDQQEQTRPDQPQTDVGRTTDDDQSMFRGCVSGTKDNYILTETNTGRQYRLHSDENIAEHVNHLVEIRGTIQAEGEIMARADERADLPQADQPADETTTPEEKDESAAPVGLDVTEIEMVAETCLSPETPQPER